MQRPQTLIFRIFAVSDVITREPVCVHKSTSLYDALLLAQRRSLRHLLVIDKDDVLVGLVTQSNMTEAYLKLLERESELETENEALYLLSHQDSLMSIGNRRAMTVALDATGALAERYKKTYSVALIDVDFFKKYNDHYGHQAGDDALVAIANAIRSTMRETDQLFRYGGEEILLLMPETGVQNANLAAERARKAVQVMAIPHKGSPLDKVTISIGIASTKGKKWEELVTRADEVLYKAKASGRNKVCAADEKVINKCIS